MAVLLVILITALDQISKYLVTVNAARLPLDVVPGIFSINLAHNRGAAFSIFQGKTLFFIIVSSLAIVVITSLLLSIRKERAGVIAHGGPSMAARLRVIEVSLSLIMGGAIGNLIDRVRFGYVVDFFDFQIWPVFNVADSAITVGMTALFLTVFFTTRAKRLF